MKFLGNFNPQLSIRNTHRAGAEKHLQLQSLRHMIGSEMCHGFWLVSFWDVPFPTPLESEGLGFVENREIATQEYVRKSKKSWLTAWMEEHPFCLRRFELQKTRWRLDTAFPFKPTRPWPPLKILKRSAVQPLGSWSWEGGSHIPALWFYSSITYYH